jgi:hypothetical protein
MRSLLVRWGVAVVVGTLWGAIVSPRMPGGTQGARATALNSDAAHYAQSTRSAQWFASPRDNNPNDL